jgi:tetratricopeptide (TPR) repeat protein
MSRRASLRHLALTAGAVALTACEGSTSRPRPDSPTPPATPPLSVVQVDSILTQPIADARRTALQADLDAARARLAAMPDDPDALIWVGRRQAYLGEYRGAIATFSEGIARFPDDARFYRHRGHRYITVREFDRAIADFTEAAKRIAGTDDAVEPDGQPNARGIPTSTLHFNIWYHLGLAHHLRGEWNEALYAYERCLTVSKNPDAFVATSYWMYLTARRAGDALRAQRILNAVPPDAEIIENTAYQQLLQYFAGQRERSSVVPADGDAVGDATLAYGLAVFDLVEGRDSSAAPFQRIVNGAGSRAAFGYIAAEAELRRR